MSGGDKEEKENMLNFYQVQITPLQGRMPCYWCKLDRLNIDATRMVTRTSSLTHRRYSDPACEWHAMPWQRAAARQGGFHLPAMAAQSRAVRRAHR